LSNFFLLWTFLKITFALKRLKLKSEIPRRTFLQTTDSLPFMDAFFFQDAFCSAAESIIVSSSPSLESGATSGEYGFFCLEERNKHRCVILKYTTIVLKSEKTLRFGCNEKIHDSLYLKILGKV